MQILSAEQIRQWDRFTIGNEPITSIELMERAVLRCLDWIENRNYLPHPVFIYCGKGNNGGDGLALARLLSQKDYDVKVFILEFGHLGTADFQVNLARLHQTRVEITFIQSGENLHLIPADALVIDALFGSGLNRKPDQLTDVLIRHINSSGNEVIAIDIPSGMFAEKTSIPASIVRASHTLSFQCYKLAFLMPENQEFIGELHILDIGLHPEFPATLQTGLLMLGEELVHAMYKPRLSFSHKGSFGHALTIAGSYGKMGAAVLAAKACLRTGAGLLTCLLPACGYQIMQVALPEAMALVDSSEQMIADAAVDLSKYSAIGMGPGLGTASETVQFLFNILKQIRIPIVLDADALNIISRHPEMLSLLPPFSILTPHPKEFERLFGKSANDFEKMELARRKAGEHQIIIVLKGHNSFIAMPGGNGYFNTTGNPGMATGGSGDVLTGILTGLLAQSYTPEQAALMGVYLHGLAGDVAAAHRSQEAMIASDIIDHLGDAFLKINVSNQ